MLQGIAVERPMAGSVLKTDAIEISCMRKVIHNPARGVPKQRATR